MYRLFCRFFLFFVVATLGPVTVAHGALLTTMVTATITPLAGEWNHLRAGDEIGFYDSADRVFVLCTNRFAQAELNCVEFPVPDFASGIPLMGRWAANEAEARPALFDPASGVLRVYSYSGCFPVDCIGSGALAVDTSHDLGISGVESAVVGDWDASGVDSVALVRPFDPSGIGTREQVFLFDDDFGSFAASTLWGLDLTGLTAIAGNWPGAGHPGDSLGFYDSVHHDVLLLDGLRGGFLLNLPLVTPGLQIFGFAVDGTGVGGFGAYFPHQCSAGDCHRVDLWRFPPAGSNGPTQVLDPLEPEMDSRFPDDPGDP
ncbi:MAG: hypothetical protein AAGM22_24185 [Acidobacteriota bacterium]